MQAILLKMQKKMKAAFSESYLNEKHKAILHRKSVITNKDYEKMVSTQKL